MGTGFLDRAPLFVAIRVGIRVELGGGGGGGGLYRAHSHNESSL